MWHATEFAGPLAAEADVQIGQIHALVTPETALEVANDLGGCLGSLQARQHVSAQAVVVSLVMRPQAMQQRRGACTMAKASDDGFT